MSIGVLAHGQVSGPTQGLEQSAGQPRMEENRAKRRGAPQSKQTLNGFEMGLRSATEKRLRKSLYSPSMILPGGHALAMHLPLPARCALCQRPEVCPSHLASKLIAKLIARFAIAPYESLGLCDLGLAELASLASCRMQPCCRGKFQAGLARAQMWQRI